MLQQQTPGARTRIPEGVDTPADLRIIEAALKETPPKLRNLEHCWRQRRRLSLATPQPSGCLKVESKPLDSQAGQAVRDPESVDCRLQTQLELSSAKPSGSAGLLPIVGHPLPAGTHQIPQSSYLIVHASSVPAEMTLLLPNEKVTILQGGRSMISVGHASDGQRSGPVKLMLEDAFDWNQGDKAKWRLVWELVTRIKSRLPLMRLYLPQGHLSLMSNAPPDIILLTHLCLTDSETPKMEGQLRVRYSRQTQLLRSSLRLASTTESSSSPNTVHVHRQLALPPLRGFEPQVDDSREILSIDRRQGLGSLSALEYTGLQQLKQLRPVWEAVEQQWFADV